MAKIELTELQKALIQKNSLMSSMIHLWRVRRSR